MDQIFSHLRPFLDPLAPLAGFLKPWLEAILPSLDASLYDRALIILAVFSTAACVGAFFQRFFLSIDPQKTDLKVLQGNLDLAEINPAYSIVQRLWPPLILFLGLFFLYRGLLSQGVGVYLGWGAAWLTGWWLGGRLGMAPALCCGFMAWVLASLLPKDTALGLFLLATDGALWLLAWRLTRPLRTRIHLRALLWLGHVYAIFEDWDRLALIVDRLKTDPRADPSDLSWLQANLALARGESDQARRLLLQLPPSLSTDRLLIGLLGRQGDLERIEERLLAHAPDTAMVLVDVLPEGGDRERIRLALLARFGLWDQVRTVLAGFPLEEGIKKLSAVAGSEGRDMLLLPLLMKAGDQEQMLKILESYDPADGPKLLSKAIPAGPGRDRILVNLLVRQERKDGLGALVAGWPPERASEALKALPPGKNRDLLLTAVWVRAGDRSSVLEYWERRAIEELKAVLKQLPASPLSEGLLARFYERDQKFEEAVNLLTRLGAGKLEDPEDVRCLARSLSGLGRQEEAVEILAQASGRLAKTDGILQDLAEVAKKLGRPHPALDTLDESRFKKLGPDALWSLVQYYLRFQKTRAAQQAALVSVNRHKDPRAAMLLGRQVEKSGRFDKAVQFYRVAGEIGLTSKGICHIHLGQFDKAVDIFSGLVPGPEQRTLVKYHLGFALTRSGRHAEAVEAFLQADPEESDRDIGRDLAVVCGLAAREAAEKGKDSEAVSWLHKGLLRARGLEDQDILGLRQALADGCLRLALAKLANPEDEGLEAQALLQEARSLRTGPWAQLDFLEGLALLKARQATQAAERFGQITEAPEEGRPARFHRALAFSADGRKDQALAQFIELIRENGDDSYGQRARLALAAIEIHAGHYDQALDYLEQVSHSGESDDGRQ